MLSDGNLVVLLLLPLTAWEASSFPCQHCPGAQKVAIVREATQKGQNFKQNMEREKASFMWTGGCHRDSSSSGSGKQQQQQSNELKDRPNHQNEMMD